MVESGSMSNVVRLRAHRRADLEERTLDEMLQGWQNPSAGGNLAFATINTLYIPLKVAG